MRDVCEIIRVLRHGCDTVNVVRIQTAFPRILGGEKAFFSTQYTGKSGLDMRDYGKCA